MCLAMHEFIEHNHSEESYIQDDIDIEEDDEPFPLDLELVAQEQGKDKEIQNKIKSDKNYKKEVIMDVPLITYKGRIYIPPCLTRDTLNWYHQYLQHPRAVRMYRTNSQTVYWPGLNYNANVW